MRKAVPQMLEIGTVLMTHETRRGTVTAAVAAAVICDKVRPKLSTLMGATGFRTLLTRALTLASRDVPALRDLKVDTAGALVLSDATTGQVDKSADITSGAVLVAQMLSLLMAFIGEALTLQILREIWPGPLLNHSHLKTGDRE
jgi:hypothetical protein